MELYRGFGVSYSNLRRNEARSGLIEGDVTPFQWLYPWIASLDDRRGVDEETVGDILGLKNHFVEDLLRGEAFLEADVLLLCKQTYDINTIKAYISRSRKLCKHNLLKW